MLLPPTPAISKMDEQVLVVPRAAFDALGAFEGLSFAVAHYFPALLDPAHAFFLRRGEAEEDPTCKQIIPYAILTHGGRVLHYVRGAASGEQRLAAKGSIGIGGHVNLSDLASPRIDEAAYHNGVRREVAEELVLETAFRESIRAVLNDESTPVGQVHLGVVHVFELESAAVSAGESEITELAFFTPAELRARRDRLETWSQICVDDLERLLG